MENTTYEDTRTAVDAKLAEWSIPFSVKLMDETKRDDWVCDQWRVMVGNMETMFFTGIGLRKPVQHAPKKDFINPRCLAAEEWNRKYLRPVAPRGADVLRSLILDSSAADMSFQDWCSDYGYSDDSLKAFDTYRQCCKIGKELAQVFKRDQIADLRTMLEDF